MANTIVDYFRSGKNLDTPEGRKLVSEADDVTLKEAAKDPNSVTVMVQMVNNSQDVFLRRNLFKALGT
jgi:phenylpyruvate tautomerase PptA (4-oxalocrotonate tautomerase family)